MSSTEIASLKGQLEKAQSSHPEKTLDILNILNSLSPTEETLRSTRIGIYLKTLRKQTEIPEISNLIKVLIDKWKGLINERRKSSTHGIYILFIVILDASTDSTAASATTKPPPSITISALVKIEDSSMVSTPDSCLLGSPPVLRERTLAIDGIRLTTTGNAVRDNCTGMLYSSLGLGSDDESSLIHKYVSRSYAIIDWLCISNALHMEKTARPLLRNTRPGSGLSPSI
jgi:hypothetical protein